MFLLVGLGAAGAAVVCGLQSVEQVAMKRQALKREMLAFGRAFLNDFERPLLVDGVTDRPVYSRMRCVPRKRRLDILLAPASGRRYPNLSDHRRNVEYDVGRIAQHLRHHSFVASTPRAEGKWVVIPFHFQPGGVASERASEPRERSAPAKRRARERVGEPEGQSPSARTGVVS